LANIHPLHWRRRARRARTAVDDGRDPAGERQAAKAKKTDTISALRDDYLAKHSRNFKRSADEDLTIDSLCVVPATHGAEQLLVDFDRT
jgi:hypothetical protein